MNAIEQTRQGFMRTGLWDTGSKNGVFTMFVVLDKYEKVS